MDDGESHVPSSVDGMKSTRDDDEDHVRRTILKKSLFGTELDL
jgi:hypothetical protein